MAAKHAVSAVLPSLAALALPALGEPLLLGSVKLWLLAALSAGGMLLQPRYDPAEATASDRGTARAFALIVLPLVLGTVLEARFWRLPEAAELRPRDALLFATMAGGLAFRTWAVRTLGAYFTLHVGFQLEQPLIRNGPYKWVRHPSYTGALLLLVPFPLVLDAYVTFLIGALALPLWFSVRIRQEEVVLRQGVGPSYDDYRRQVPALVPRLWGQG